MGKTRAGPFRKRREFDRVRTEITRQLYSYDRLQEDKKQSPEKHTSPMSPKSPLSGSTSDFRSPHRGFQPVYTYKIIPKGGLKIKREKARVRGAP